MTNDALAALIGGFILTHGLSIWGAAKYVLVHIINYTHLQRDVKEASDRIEKLETDLSAAFNKIRELEKCATR